MSATPSLVGHYLQHIAAPATTAAYNHLAERAAMPPMRLGSTVQACGLVMEQIDLRAIAVSLTAQRGIAVDGRPRGESAGPRAKGGVSRPTESAGDEMERIRQVGRDLEEALNRVHPDPGWPAIESGRRGRVRVATEVLAEMCADAWGTLCPEKALDDLANAVDMLHVNVADAAAKARKAAQCRAWGRASEVDPPDPVLEAMRCSGWPLGRHNGERIQCSNFVGEKPHAHPELPDEHHHADLCDSCYALLCRVCWSAPRRTPGAKDCTTCSVRASRQRKAAA